MSKRQKKHAGKNRPLYTPKSLYKAPSVNHDLQDQLQNLSEPRNVVDMAIRRELSARYQTALLEQYNKALAGNGMPSLETLTSMDTIDVRDAIAPNENGDWCFDLSTAQQEKVDTYARTNGWLACLPCLPEGVLRDINDGGTYFQFKHLDAERRMLELRLVPFVKDSAGLVYRADIHVTVNFAQDLSPEKSFSLLMEDVRLRHQIYESINGIRHCGWNAADDAIWKAITKKMGEHDARYEAEVHEANHMNVPSHLVIGFLSAMIAINGIMHTDPSPTQEPPQGRTDDDTAIILGDRNYTPAKTVRTYGGSVKITSVHDVSAPVGSIKYTVPAWTVRGHVRRYKSGKVSYVRPHVSTRHGLDADAVDMKQTILLIKKGETEDHD